LPSFLGALLSVVLVLAIKFKYFVFCEYKEKILAWHKIFKKTFSVAQSKNQNLG
jgi:hypothetical protein